jgi:hypothetical protein
LRASPSPDLLGEALRRLTRCRHGVVGHLRAALAEVTARYLLAVQVRHEPIVEHRPEDELEDRLSPPALENSANIDGRVRRLHVVEDRCLSALP